MTVSYLCNTQSKKILTNNITAEEHPQNLEPNYVGRNTCDYEETK